MRVQTWNLWVSCRGGARLSRRVLEALLSAACETSAWTTAQTLAARLLGSDTQTLAALLQAEGNSEDLTIDELRRRAPAASKLSAAALCCAAVALMQPSSGTQVRIAAHRMHTWIRIAFTCKLRLSSCAHGLPYSVSRKRVGMAVKLPCILKHRVSLLCGACIRR